MPFAIAVTIVSCSVGANGRVEEKSALVVVVLERQASCDPVRPWKQVTRPRPLATWTVAVTASARTSHALLADLDHFVRARVADREADWLFGAIGHGPDLEAVDAKMRVVPAVADRDVAEDAVMLLRAEVDLDRLDDVKRCVLLDGDVRSEPLNGPALVR
ncbi:MAG: hypothetical protein AUH39_02935 [Chloroflexi bacterium 13_1_40CM_67_9]|nr:MAG: hypothetical protein AUH39_02935 [Chloroflexi bacterium 13_1_40CM_67_9]